ncbi:unnamed protein product [Phytophthora fragariaefolia]|uniref:Unnamed protein product n=1 Tax=Phytophthora fragariaefolia TaxID=1490495 RepID=A0A9W7CWP1_9STRA|nr:unnamed protein product [Phytophthora fragariaefolia]
MAPLRASQIPPETLHAGDIFAYYSITFVCGDSRDYREVVVLSIDCTDNLEYPVSVDTGKIIEVAMMVKRVRTASNIPSEMGKDTGAIQEAIVETGDALHEETKPLDAMTRRTLHSARPNASSAPSAVGFPRIPSPGVNANTVVDAVGGTTEELSLSPSAGKPVLIRDVQYNLDTAILSSPAIVGASTPASSDPVQTASQHNDESENIPPAACTESPNAGAEVRLQLSNYMEYLSGFNTRRHFIGDDAELSQANDVAWGLQEDARQRLFARDELETLFDVGSDADMEDEQEEHEGTSSSTRVNPSMGSRRPREDDSDASSSKRSRCGSDRPLADAGSLSSPRCGDDSTP